jgi:hypothetical protein
LLAQFSRYEYYVDMKPELELLFQASVSLQGPVVVGQTPTGVQRVVPIAGGTFEGSQIRGTVCPGGADWQFTRSDGVVVLDARYLLRTDDGVLIEVRNRGLRHGPEEVLRRIAAGDDVDPGLYYFRAAPVFSAPTGKYDWLNRSLFVCTGNRRANAVEIAVYRIT